MLHGVDVSNNNGIVSLAQQTQKDFAIAKVSEGTHFLDPDFKIYWAMMAEDKMLRGAYHFLDLSDPTAQAHVFVNAVKANGLEANDILCADVEHAGLHAPLVRQFVNEVERLTNKNVFVYTMYSYIQTGVVNGLYDKPLWIANPGGTIGAPPSVHPFQVWTIQQYDWHGVDKNVFNGTKETWVGLANRKTRPELRVYQSRGNLTLAQIADDLDSSPSTLLRLTAEHSNKAKEFSARQATWINDVFRGRVKATDPVPKGIHLFYRK